MTRHAVAPSHRPLFLSQEEALALLDLCLLDCREDSPVRAQLMAKLGDLCREFLRDGRPERARAHRATIVDEAVHRLLRTVEGPPQAVTSRA